jgi:hypothetical protein
MRRYHGKYHSGTSNGFSGAMRFILFLLFAVELWAGMSFVVPAADYFVDGLHGSDSNAGTLIAPFATATKALSVASSGKVVAVYGGPSCASRISYHEQATIPSGVALVGWGGCQPRFDASDAISAAAWSKTGGYTNIYQAPVTTTNAAGVGFLCVWENGVCGPNFPYVSSLASLDAATNGYYIASQSAITGTSQTVYVHATGSGNPASNANLYEFNPRLYGIFSAYGVVVSNVQTRRNLYNDGSFAIDKNSFATDIEADDGGKHNLIVHGGSYFQNISVNNSYYAGQAKNRLVVYDNTPNNANVTLVNVSATETTESGGSIFGHTGSGSFGVVFLTNPNLAAGTGGYSGVAANQQIISGGTIADGVSLEDALNLITGTTVNAQVQVSGATEISNCTISYTGANGAIRSQFAGSSINIHDNTISTTTAFDSAIRLDATPAALTVLRNVFPQTVQISYVAQAFAATVPSNAVIDFNTYHYPGGSNPSNPYGGTNYSLVTQWAAWQTLGFDVHSTVATP